MQAADVKRLVRFETAEKLKVCQDGHRQEDQGVKEQVEIMAKFALLESAVGASERGSVGVWWMMGQARGASLPHSEI